MYSIYQLIDPRDDLPYYIGVTSGLDARFEQHIRCDGSNPAKDAWILGLREQGLAPIIQQVEMLSSKSEAQEREVIWIRSLVNQGMPLLNRSGVVEERATIEVSLYLYPSQDEKLEDLRRAYKRQTKKKISANELIRRLVEKATLDDIL